MRGFVRELRLAMRSLGKRPGFTLAAVLTLGLGIGATTAIVAVVHAVLIRPLPYFESERVVRVTHGMPGLNMPNLENSNGTVQLYTRFARSFESVAAFTRDQQNLTGLAEPARVNVLNATPTLFEVLRVLPRLGRLPTADDAAASAPAVAVLTQRGWQRHFASDNSVVGRVVSLNGRPVEIIGVLPAVFAHPNPDAEMVLPLRIDAAQGFGVFGRTRVLARLRPGVTLEAAVAEIRSIQPRLTELYPDFTAELMKRAGWSVQVMTMRDWLVRDAERALWIVLATVSFLLLVACASVANLFLVRGDARQREVGVRFALGATRARVASTFLSESLLLTMVSGALGVFLAWLGVHALVAASPAQLPRLHEVSLGPLPMTFAVLISVLAGIVFGLLPLPQQLRRPLSGLVRAGRSHTGTHEQQRLRKVLIVGQIALALIMVIGSGLMLRSYQQLRAVDPGVRPAGLLTVSLSLGDTPAGTPVPQRLVDAIRALPGVTHAAAVDALPLEPGGISGGSVSVQGDVRPENEPSPVVFYATVSEQYFDAVGTRLLQGRAIERADIEAGRRVTVVSETFARTFLQGNALGRRVSIAADSTWFEVVGVAADVRLFYLREEVRPMAYVPLAARTGLLHVIARTGGDPLVLVNPIRSAVRTIDPTIPIISARPFQQILDESVADTMFTMNILLIAAFLALALGAMGLYGVIGYMVSQRTQEIGVRIALGAVPARVQGLVLRQGLVLAGLGVAVGLAAAAALSRLLGTLLYQVGSRDPLTFTIVPLLMVAVSCLACWLPARRAARVSPLEALRSD